MNPFAIASLFLGFLVIGKGIASPEVERELRLVADAKSGTSAAAQIHAAFGEKAIESPDRYPENHPGVPHIIIEEDPQMGAYFKFLLFRDHDGDREKSREESDRQRNEIKGYWGSDEALKATHGQVARYHWKFRIDSDLQVSYQFCHLFQLKGVGGDDVGDPIFTISAALSKEVPVLELRYWKGEGAREKKIELAKLNSVKQTWLSCDFIVDYQERGSFRFSLTSADGSVISSVEDDKIDTWRDQMDFCRPKWGIYRSLKG
ncbi:MAG: hypothetical protein AAGH89_06155 [Verrucomicrobiota bacterium]